MSNKKGIRKVILWLVLLSGLFFLLWRAPYGFCFNDEGFYVSLAQRMYQGDALIADEWHGTQNFGPVLLPMYALFRLFTQSNEGILLFLRYVYCLLWWGTCLIVYKTLAKQYKGAILVFLYLIFFSPADYMNISYNSVGLICVLLLCCIAYSVPAEEMRNAKTGAVVFSVLWIGLTLCSPFMAAVYLCVCVICFCMGRKRADGRQGKSGNYFRNLSMICKFSVGIVGVAAVLYLYLFVFSRAEFSKVMDSIPLILSDPEHSSISFWRSVINVPGYLFEQYPLYCIAAGITIILGFFLKCKKIRLVLFGLCSGLFIYGQLTLDIWDMYSENLVFNTQVLYISILGAVAFSLLEKRPWKLFGIFYGAAIAYAIVNNITSNTALMTISMAMSVAGVCGIVCIVLLTEELLAQYEIRGIQKLASVAVACVVFAAQFGIEISIRFHRTFFDEPLYTLTGTIQEGAAKGLRTNPFYVNKYGTIYENLTCLLAQVDTEGKTFLSCTSAPYIYLDAGLKMETFSAWSFGYGEQLGARILDYQQLQGEQPDLIFCASEEDVLPEVTEGYDVLEYNGAYLFVKP